MILLRKFELHFHAIHEEWIMNLNEIAELSSNILIQYYNNNIQPFLDACHSDVLWIGPAEKQIIRTKKALCDAFAAERHDLTFALHNLEVTPLSTGTSQVMEILMTFLVDTFWPNGSSNRVDQRIQLSWVNEKRQPRIRICHISNAICYDNRDQIYPVHFNESFKEMIFAGGNDPKASKHLCFKGPRKAVFYLEWSNILYAESAGEHTMVHTTTQTYKVYESLRAIENHYSEYFFRCHNNYLVNPDYIQEIVHFHLVLTNGTSIPVPEKKFKAVKTRLDEIIYHLYPPEISP